MAHEITGTNFIGQSASAQGSRTYAAYNPAIQTPLGEKFHDATPAEIDRALQLADAAFEPYRQRGPAAIAAFLEAIADEIEALGDALLQRTHAETALPLARLTAERQRTINQTRLFARLAREQAWVQARIDPAQPDRKPLPRVDVRSMLVPIGPVVVFGASNFPLAISVTGCDALSALAVGCPIVVKAHPAHPGTCELMARAVLAAARKTAMPDGVFSLLHGAEPDVGLALVRHELTQAVAFTGSERVGRILFDAAAARPRPIPVYAEMGSINPVFVLPGALAERTAQIADGFVQSMVLGVGQFCTQPGVLVGVATPQFNTLVAKVGEIAAQQPAAVMVSKNISDAFHGGVEKLRASGHVRQIGAAAGGDAKTNSAAAVLFGTDAETWHAKAELRHEIFGPSTIAVNCKSVAELTRLAESLQGQLTATIHGTPEDLREHAELVRILERKAGRIVINGYPTGVEVGVATHHGGPYPAATHSFFTSIGTESYLRFVRPVAYQNFSDENLPPPLRNKNTHKLWRAIDGEMTQRDI